MSADTNTAWSGALAEALARHGLRHVVISPGSRSAPLALAFARHANVEARAIIDERGAAYFALGAARATGLPAAVVSTSGTAAANYLPAVVEADRAQVPLIVLTADRPYELTDIGANQAIDQLKLYGDRVRWFAHLGLPESGRVPLSHLRTVAARAWTIALGPPGGPVHLNLPFREPLSPAGRAEGASMDTSDPRTPLVRTHPPTWTPDPDAVASVGDEVLASGRGLIVAGPMPPTSPGADAVADLARNLGCPVVADPLSGLRAIEGPPEPLSTAYDALLEHDEFRRWARPDWVLRFGSTPTSKRLTTWLSDLGGTPHTVVDASSRFPDATHAATRLVAADPSAFCAALSQRLVQPPSPDDAWTTGWDAADAAARQALAAEADWEGTIPAAAADGLDAGDLLFVSNSLPVRDLDRYAGTLPPGLIVLANRGASGIDGVVSTAAGAAHAAIAGRARLVVGDVALHHDVTGLTAVRDHAPGLVVIVVNNQGGAIFDQLPVARTPGIDYERLFRTPPRVDLAALAEAHGLPFHRIKEGADLAAAFDRTPAGLVEVVVDPKASLDRRRRLAADVGQRIADALARVEPA